MFRKDRYAGGVIASITEIVMNGLQLDARVCIMFCCLASWQIVWTWQIDATSGSTD